MNTARVLLSIKPEYANLIFSGEKKYEFRKLIFKNPKIKQIMVYASRPVSKIIGEFEVDDILSFGIEELWLHTMNHAGINKEYYNTYFAGKEIGYAIKIKNVKRYSKHKELKEFNVKRAPQSFMYINC